VTSGILGIDEAADWQSERVGNAGGDTIVVAQCGGSEPLELLGLEELLAGGDGVAVLP
jgi:hypothetical protein